MAVAAAVNGKLAAVTPFANGSRRPGGFLCFKCQFFCARQGCRFGIIHNNLTS